MDHRISCAMNGKKGKLGGIIEADETYIGGKEKNKHFDKKLNAGRGGVGKIPVFALVERKGKVISIPVKTVTGNNLKSIIRENVKKSAKIMTDDFTSYNGLSKNFFHSVANHGKGEYVRDDVHTNTVENYFSILKRGITGVYHHVGEHHLHRYLSEFNFRYNERKIDDDERSMLALHGIEGKRLMYRDSSVNVN
ncbi:MAG: IS1595 family transposase [Smithella sp.]